MKLRHALLPAAVPLVLVAVAAACEAPSDEPFARASSATTTADAVLTTARQRLAAAGYTIQNGTFTFFDVCGCYGAQTCTTDDGGATSCTAKTSCYGNNPSSPYGEYSVPPYPGVAGSPATSWQLAENEAIVFYGATPPAGAYFSFRSYDAIHVYSSGTRARVGASLGDSLNDRVISTMGTLAGGSAFSSQAVVVTTGDTGVYGDVAAAFDQGAAFDKRAVNADIIDRSVSTMGIGTNADTFNALVRMAVPTDSAAMCTYQANAATALHVLRVTKLKNYVSAPIAAPALRSRGSATETAAVPSSFPAQIAAYYQAHGLNVSSSLPSVTGAPDTHYGYFCIANQVDCADDNRDAVYTPMRADSTSKPLTFELGGGSFPNSGACSSPLACPYSRTGDTASAPRSFVVYGVNHAVTGFTTYTNVTIYDAAMALGVLSVAGTSNAHPLFGSANRYLGPGNEAFYAWRFARSCVLPDGTVDAECSEVPASFPGVALGATLQFTERAYLNPATNTAPPIPTTGSPGGIQPPQMVVLAPM